MMIVRGKEKDDAVRAGGTKTEETKGTIKIKIAISVRVKNIIVGKGGEREER